VLLVVLSRSNGSRRQLRTIITPAENNNNEVLSGTTLLVVMWDNFTGTHIGVRVERLKLNVGVSSHAEILESEGLFTQRSRPVRNVGESVGGILEVCISDWSNGIRIRCHILDTSSETEFKLTAEKQVIR
jgi:hypothetical protein